MTFSEPYTPYCGLEYNERGQPVRVTRPRMSPSAPDARRQDPQNPRARRRATSRPTVLVLIQTRFSPTGNPALGQRPDRVLKLSPVKTETWPSDVRAMVSDPTAAITTPDEALTVAETMLATSGVGFGGATAGASVSSGGLWESTAAPRSLHCSTLPAHAAINKECLGVEAAENYGLPGPQDHDDDSGPAVLAPHVPPESWMKAYQLCPHPELPNRCQPCSVWIPHARQRRDHRPQSHTAGCA